MRASRMKRPLTALAFILFMTAASAQEAAPHSPAPDKDPFVATWQANRDKSRPKLGKKDASYTRTIARDGEDVVFSSRIGTSKPSENNYRIRCDGLFHPVQFGSLSCKYDAPNLMEGETMGLDERTSYWTREVSTDGQEMKISAYEDPGRTKVKSILILDRVK
jgi:hypothetical protein